MKTFKLAHFSLMATLRDPVKLFSSLSATRQRLVMELIEEKLMKIDDEGFLFNSEKGDHIIDTAISYCDQEIKAMRT